MVVDGEEKAVISYECRKKGIGLFDAGHAFQPQLNRETRLHREDQALNATLGLRDTCGFNMNSQLHTGITKLSRCIVGYFRVAALTGFKNSATVSVEHVRNTIIGEDLMKYVVITT